MCVVLINLAGSYIDGNADALISRLCHASSERNNELVYKRITYGSNSKEKEKEKEI